MNILFIFLIFVQKSHLSLVCFHSESDLFLFVYRMLIFVWSLSCRVVECPAAEGIHTRCYDYYCYYCFLLEGLPPPYYAFPDLLPTN